MTRRLLCIPSDETGGLHIVEDVWDSDETTSMAMKTD